jgi:hypothetical protein
MIIKIAYTELIFYDNTQRDAEREQITRSVLCIELDSYNKGTVVVSGKLP